MNATVCVTRSMKASALVPLFTEEATVNIPSALVLGTLLLAHPSAATAQALTEAQARAIIARGTACST
jgi:hypothetical protein